jgi:hypothetical protein
MSAGPLVVTYPLTGRSRAIVAEELSGAAEAIYLVDLAPADRADALGRAGAVLSHDTESIPPERLMRALLLQAFYSIRSERQLVDRLDHDLLFRWFVGLGIEDAVWDATTFTKNRDRLLEGAVSGQFLAAVQISRGVTRGSPLPKDKRRSEPDLPRPRPCQWRWRAGQLHSTVMMPKHVRVLAL